MTDKYNESVDEMKSHHISIKCRIFQYLLGFCFLLLIILWLLQTVFLDSFYKRIKLIETEKLAVEYAQLIKTADWEKLYEHVARQGDVFVEVWTPGTGSIVIGQINRNIQSFPGQFFEARSSQIMEYPHPQYTEADKRALLSETEKNGGKTAIKLFNEVGAEQKRRESILYALTLPAENDNKSLLLVSSFISPVNATVDALRIQLVHISLIMVALSVIMAFLISKRVSKPIEQLNASAKSLGQGNYETSFPSEGYLEITELASTLNQAAKELAKTDSLRKELIANVSHDLRTPLTLISGYSEMIRDLPGENKPENMQVIIDESKRLISLVNNLLDLSQLESGVIAMNFAVFDLTQEIQNIMHRFSRLSDQEGYIIRFEPEQNVKVYADPERIAQVIYNFLINAVTHTGADKLVNLRQTIKENKVVLEVIDTGEGIEEEKLKDIWERYYKVDKVHKRSEVGTGLGLYIVKSILDQHEDVDYGVKSIPGHGSTFWFSLPLASPLPHSPA